MKIVTEYADEVFDVLEIKSAKYLKDYVIDIVFTDGTKQTIDFEPFLIRSQHPEIRQFLDKSKFRGYKLVDGNLNWNDYRLIFPVEDLYKGNI